MIRAAYIGYMSDQNEPSRPELIEFDQGEWQLRYLLFELWSGLSEDDEGNPVPVDNATLEDGGAWGDVCVTDGDVALYVTFHADDRMTALQKLGMA